MFHQLYKSASHVHGQSLCMTIPPQHATVTACFVVGMTLSD